MPPIRFRIRTLMITIAALALAMGVIEILAVQARVSSARLVVHYGEPCVWIDFVPKQPTDNGSGTIILSEAVVIPLISNFVPLALTITLPALAFYCWSRRKRRVESPAISDPTSAPCPSRDMEAVNDHH
jgi:hypothetical protein